MGMLIVGLVMFLGVHSVRIVADGWRTQVRAHLGEKAWKGLYSLVSALGLVFIVYGYGAARAQPVMLWPTPMWTRHLAGLLTLPALVMLVAAYVPGNAIKARVKHPMLLGVKTWAVAHLLANGNLADLLLFGGFLLWAVLDFRAARQRDRAQQIVYPPGRAGPTVVTLLVGVAAWAVIAFWAHAVLIGVKPFA